MKNSAYARFSLSLLLVLSLMSPMATLAFGDGKKHFKQGMRHEVAEEWDKAVEEFAAAVNENPKNPEYRLHLQRALFNASQMYMKKGNTAAQEKDYQAAYMAFRKAYAYDPVNELAKAEMARMVRMQEALQKGEDPAPKADDNGKVKLVPTSFNAQPAAPDFQMPQRLEKMRDVPFPGGVDLQYIVKELAKDLDLNVLFDAESRLENRKIRIELKNVTAAKALDYIFLQENLFFQKVGPRTILVATGNRRTNFQQLVLRTFYLANASPKDVKAVITAAIPAQPGRSQTIVIEDATTNSLTIRDTEENVRLFSKLISSLDKDRAEVVMDVAIYEVNKTDLLRIGNQLGIGIGDNNVNQLNNLGGTNAAAIPFKGNFAAGLATNIASGLLIPSSVISAFQSKGNTKLLASTQIHAFNNEDSSARIGQRVPVRTAQFVGVGTNTPGSDGVVSNVINYEQVGLTLKFKPIVFPNQDVQVAMEIESKDVASGGTFDNPIFTERTIKGTARVQNNKTLLLASVAQDVESNGRAGLPVLGWLPIIGRLFSTPERNNRQVDIVIAVTPRVIRAPAILPEDEVERPTGSLATPTSGSLEAMIIQEEREELLAAARRLPTTAQVQLPDRPAETPAYVRSGAASTPAATTPDTSTAVPDTTQSAAPKTDGLAMNLVPIDTGVKTLQINPTSDTSNASSQPATSDPAASQVELTLGPNLSELKAGDKIKVPVMVKSSGSLQSAVFGVSFDEKKLAVRTVLYGDIFGMGLAGTSASPFLNQGGKMFVSLTAAEKTLAGTNGVLAFVEVEALVDGKPEIVLVKDVLNFRAVDGRSLAIKF
ncbi:MAG TPA: secretin N-terminal domain-containing protein [Pyrinomonadaceae bacterium]